MFMLNLNQFRRNKVFNFLWMGLFLLTVTAIPAANAATQLSQFGITWTFNGDYQTGQFANGDYWVVGPVTIVNIDPASVSGSRTMNGSMVNPSPTYGTMQGYDSAMYGPYGPAYSDSLNAALNVSSSNPLTLQPGSSLVSTISISTAGSRPQIKSASILTVLNAAAPQGAFRPPYCNNDKTIKFNKNQLEYALLATLSPVAGTLALSTVERYFERPWIDHVPGWSARYTHPADTMPDYGDDLASQITVGALALQLNYSNAEKETLLTRYVQLGIDLYGITQDGGQNNWTPNGGHASGRKWPIIFAGIMLNDYNMINIGSGGMGNPFFGEDGQTFYVSQSDVSSGRYSSSDLGLPEWGIRHATDPSMDNSSWDAPYRQCCTANSWGGVVLSARIMGAITLWNHDALFDYMDRYMDLQYDGSFARQLSPFSEAMWDTYRADYGAIWPNTTPPEQDTTPPLAPTNLSSDSQTDSSISLSWTAPGPASDGDTATGYRVYRDLNYIGGASGTSYVDAPLAAETSYSYQVFSTDNAGNQSTSPATGTFATLASDGDGGVTPPPPPPTGTTYYISSDGNSSNSGATWTQALRELPSSLVAGAVYYVAGGDYPAYNFDDSASSTEPITVIKSTSAYHGTDEGWQAGYATNQAVFDTIDFNGASYITIDGQIQNGIKIWWSGPVQDSSRTLRLANSNNINIKNCEIDGNFQSSGGNQTTGSCTLAHIENCSYITIENCIMHDAADDGLQMRDSSNIYLINNEIYNLYGCGTDGGCGPCYNGHSDGIELYNITNSELIGNYIHDFSSNSALFFGNWATSTSDYCENILLANNIFYNNRATGFTLYIEQTNGIELYNNVFWGRADANYGGLSLGRYISNLEMYNNIILSVDYLHIGGSYDPANHHGDYNYFGVALGQWPLGANDIAGSDPGFVGINGATGSLIANPVKEEFMLDGSSPCIDSGTAGGPAYDILNNTRPQGSGYDIGAFELTDETPDTEAPTVVSVRAGENTLDISFSEALDSSTAENIANYSIDNGITISAAALSTQNNTVTLQTSTHTPDTTYQVTVSGVTDTAGNAMTQAAIDYTVSSGLVGHWQFDEQSGTTSEDLSGSANTAVLLNGLTLTGSGQAQFDGVDDVIEISMQNISAGEGTIVVTANLNTATGLQYLFGHTVGTWTNNIQLYTNEGNLAVGLGNSHTTATGIEQLQTGRLYTVALTWSGTQYNVYIDGIQQAEGSFSGLSTVNSFADIGNNGNPDWRHEPLNGSVDEARLYSYALTAQEIAELAEVPGPDPEDDITLIGHWKFNEQSGTTAADSSGYDNTALLLNGASFTAAGELSMDGTDDTIEISSAQMEPDKGTVALWIKPQALAGYKYLFGHSIGDWDQKIQLYIDEENLTIGLGDAHNLATNIETLTTEEYYHILLAWDATSYAVYVNGVEKAAGTYTGLDTLNTFADIGNNGNLDWRHEAFQGLIDDVRLYNRRITAEEIEVLAQEFRYGYEKLAAISASWLGYSPEADIAPPGGDGVVNILDFLELSKYWDPQTPQ